MDSFLDNYTGLLPFLVRALSSKSTGRSQYCRLGEEQPLFTQQHERKLRSSEDHHHPHLQVSDSTTVYRTSSFNRTATPRRSTSMPHHNIQQI
ncbi:unnamed protein product [Sphagnum jensenii]|uniref:Uncharacterized protein n=1 Tax=Sphagnum jensenii TaxID=128206 RepID=A0ABP1B7J1_9BRYO